MYPKSLLTSYTNRYRVTWMWELDVEGRGRSWGSGYDKNILYSRNSQKYIRL